MNEILFSLFGFVGNVSSQTQVCFKTISFV